MLIKVLKIERTKNKETSLIDICFNALALQLAHHEDP